MKKQRERERRIILRALWFIAGAGLALTLVGFLIKDFRSALACALTATVAGGVLWAELDKEERHETDN